jgi:hypothetical protein
MTSAYDGRVGLTWRAISVEVAELLQETLRRAAVTPAAGNRIGVCS